MTQENQSERLFSGKFKVVSLYLNVVEQGWTLFRRYGPKTFLWEFIPDKTLNFPSGTVAYEGKLHEHFRESPKEVTEFAWYPEDKQLYIDRSDYEPDGFINICINDRYRVERINKTDFWLYDLEDVENEPEDYRFRMKVKIIE